MKEFAQAFIYILLNTALNNKVWLSFPTEISPRSASDRGAACSTKYFRCRFRSLWSLVDFHFTPGPTNVPWHQLFLTNLAIIFYRPTAELHRFRAPRVSAIFSFVVVRTHACQEERRKRSRLTRTQTVRRSLRDHKPRGPQNHVTRAKVIQLVREDKKSNVVQLRSNISCVFVMECRHSSDTELR